MPAIDSLLAALAATLPDVATPETISSDPAGFERAMTDALAPEEKKPDAKNPGRPALKPALPLTAKISAPAGGPAKTDAAEAVPDDGRTPKTDSEKKIPVEVAPKISASTGMTPPLLPATAVPAFVPTVEIPAPVPAGKISAPSPGGNPLWAGTSAKPPAKNLPANATVPVELSPAMDEIAPEAVLTESHWPAPAALPEPSAPALPQLTASSPRVTEQTREIFSESNPLALVKQLVETNSPTATPDLSEEATETPAPDAVMPALIPAQHFFQPTNFLPAGRPPERIVPERMTPTDDENIPTAVTEIEGASLPPTGAFFRSQAPAVELQEPQENFLNFRAGQFQTANPLAENTIENNPANPATVFTAAGRESVLQMESPPVNGSGPVPPPARDADDLQKTGVVAKNETESAKNISPVEITAAVKPALNVFAPVAAPSPTIPREVETVDSKIVAASVPVAEKSGTRVASTPPAMKNSDKMEVLAGLVGQKLPDAGPVRLAPGLITRGPAELPPRISENVAGKYAGEFISNFAGAEVRSSIPAADFSTPAVTLPPLAEARSQTVERTHELITHHALRLAEVKADSLSVVLKPDAGTELSLQLRQRDGVLEAQAVLTAGDRDLLGRHWAELQSRLELHGVKLSSLGGDTNFSAGGNNFSRSRTPERDAETENALAFAEFSAATGGGATARSAGLYGWESWA